METPRAKDKDMETPPLDFSSTCRLAGQLFLQSQHEIDYLRKALSECEGKLRLKDLRVSELEEEVRRLSLAVA